MGKTGDEMTKKALLALEDGTIFEGQAFGAIGESCGEVVFNTSMTGYQEVLTDPSYRGQIVAMTYPLIGNYGVNSQDVESRRIWVEGFVIRELSPIASNSLAEKDLDTYLREQGIPGIHGIDTRELTERIRTVGAMKAVLSSVDLDADSLIAKARSSPGLKGKNLVEGATCQKPYKWSDAGPVELSRSTEGNGRLKVIVIDCGVKYGILRSLRAVGCDLTVVPAWTTAEEIAAMKPDGLMLSNGPGDPEPVSEVILTVRALIENPPGGEPLPIFGICLGQQILALALGGKTFKLKFGHHGANHPVKDLQTGKVLITVQNHGFCVDIDSLPTDAVEITHINLNDQTLEGIRHKYLPIFSVQYHPEASPGPHDARYMFDRFVDMIKEHRR